MVVPKARRAHSSNALCRVKYGLVAALLSLATGCVSNDPRFVYDEKNPLDEAILYGYSTENTIERFNLAVQRLTDERRTTDAVNSALSRHGAQCREVDMSVRCTYAKAKALSIPSPIPFVGHYWQVFYDFEIDARRDRTGSLHISVCLSKYGGMHVGRDEAKARQRVSERACKTLSRAAKAPSPRK